VIAGDGATIRALHTALQHVRRDDVIDALLTLTPLYRYVNNNSDNNNFDPAARHLRLQGHHPQGQGQGRQRPVSSSVVWDGCVCMLEYALY